MKTRKPEQGHSGSRHIADPRVSQQEVKLVCAWCNAIIRAGPDEKLSHGICRDCEKLMRDEIRQSRCERDRFTSYHDGRCRGPFDYVEGQLILGSAVLVIVFLVVMAAEGLHWLTGGRVPELIDWQSKKSDPFKIKTLQDQGNPE